MKRYGFVYIWFDSKRKKYYIGSHLGPKNDRYIGSNKLLKCAYKSRPHTFKRRILFEGYFNSHKELLFEEEKWLSLIKDNELNVKYYNQKKVAAGGDIISTLTEEKRQEHKRKSISARVNGHKKWLEVQTPEMLSERAKYARSKVVDRSRPSKFGEENYFFGKKHSDESRAIMSKKARERTVDKTRAKKYLIKFSNGSSEIHHGLKSITETYCSVYRIKFSKFLDTGVPISSNRKKSQKSPLIGAFIETII